MARLQPGRGNASADTDASLAGSLKAGNSLNALRLLLASLVIVSHAPLAGYGDDPYHWGDLEIGGWAVAGFFAISGWLITASRMRLGFAPFIWRRCLRILPGFWVALVVTAFVLAPLSSVWEGTWRSSGALAYVWQNVGLLVHQKFVPDTLAGVPFPGNWNLSLWTLSWEFACYLAVGIGLFLPLIRRSAWPLMFGFAAATAMHALLAFSDQPWGTHGMEVGLRLFSFFLAGAMLYRYGERVSTRLLWPVLALLVLVVLAWQGWVAVFGGLPLGYLVLWASGAVKLAWGTKNDISYGMYIYAFPVQQILAVMGMPSRGLPVYVGVTVAVTSLLAWGSWLFIEKPAMRWKRLVPAGPHRTPAVDHLGSSTGQ